MRLLLALIMCCVASPTAAGAAEAQVRAYLDRLIAEGHSPGAQYMFVSPDAVLVEHNAGVADLVAGNPVTSRTTFNAFSVTKTFTAAAVLRLAEERKLDLDAPVSRYPDVFPYAKSPTIRQTLTHSGGFPNPNPLPWVHLAEEHAAFDQAQFVRDVLRKHDRLRSEPGQSVAYSNLGYLLLGEVIAKVSGQPYTRHIEQQLIAPLQLRNGQALAFTIAQPLSHASGYVERLSLLNLALGWFIDRERFVDGRSGRWVQLRPLYVNGAAYGGLIGNAAGMGRYLRALLGRDGTLSPATRALLLTPASGPDGKALPHSLGWFVGQLDGETYYAHAGGGPGYYCEVRVYPRIERASVVMFNRTGIRDERALDRIDTFFLAGREGNASPGPSVR